MKQAFFVCAALAALISISGCAATRGSCARAPGTCAAVCRGAGRACHGPEMAQAGPPTGAVAYPYYTTRGPRDFLASDPPSIGP